MSEHKSAALSFLAVVTAIVALGGLLPIAGGLPAIASPVIPLADAMWFTANLAGALLLLAAGFQMLFRRATIPRYVCGYTILLIVIGELRLWFAGFHRLTLGWLVMAVCIGVLLIVLRRVWLWALVGGIWSGLILGFWCYGGIVSYVSASAPQFPALLFVQAIGCVSAIVIGLAYLRFR